MIAAIAAALLRLAMTQSPGLAARPPTIVVERITACGGHTGTSARLIKGCFWAVGNGRIAIDPRTPRRQVRTVIVHELRHASAYAEGRDWTLGEPVG